MSRAAIDVGAFTWARIQRLYNSDAVAHWQRCEAEGLQCPQEVFTQLFHAEDPHVVPTENPDARPGGPSLSDLRAVKAVDWGRVSWNSLNFLAMRSVRCASTENTNTRSMRRDITQSVMELWMSGRRRSVTGKMRRVG